MAHRVSVFLGQLLACGAAAFFGARVFANLPVEWNGAILGIVAGLVTVLSGVSLAVFSKLDALLKDSEEYDELRSHRVYLYIHRIRVRLLLLLVLTVGCGLIVGAIAILLPKLQDPSAQLLSRLFVVAYGCAGFILLYMVRIAYAYARLDSFRRDMLDLISAENRRVAALKELRPSALRPFEKSGSSAAVAC